jgi:hypothetical protein
MSIPDDDDTDFTGLLDRLSSPLRPDDRAAFRRAAADALASLACSGPGAAYRAVSVLQRQYFDPPDLRGNHQVRERISKLRAAPAIGAEDPRTGARARRQFAG